jgi:hypothetical protein
MSIESWKEEFYPVTAKEIAEHGTEQELIEHSLKKWNGLTKENLEKHQLTKKFFSISDNKGKYFSADGGSCALCQKYDDICSDCPLSKVRDNIECSAETDEEEENGQRSPWFEWTTNNNPEYMIYWLNKAKEATND